MNKIDYRIFIGKSGIMKETISTVQLLKQRMEMNNGGMFWSLLRQRKNRHFMIGTLRNPDHGYFEPDVKIIVWSNEVLLTNLKDEESQPYDEIIIDVEISWEFRQN